jgi:hypothetical protein
MTLDEMKKKALGLIEEVNPDNPNLTDDPDIAAKINDVVNMKMYELCLLRKLQKYVEMPVTKGELVTFEAIEKVCGYEVYQIANVCGVNFASKAGGTVLKILESGTAEIECYVYPERITDKTKGNYEFELPSDLLEIMPYGIAGDLLKSDISTEYGSIYSAEYEKRIQRLDPRYQMTTVTFEGGVSI